MTIAEFLQMYPYAGIDFENRRLCYSGQIWQVWSLDPVTHHTETLLMETMDEAGAVILLENGIPPEFDPDAQKEGV